MQTLQSGEVYPIGRMLHKQSAQDKQLKYLKQPTGRVNLARICACPEAHSLPLLSPSGNLLQ
jgi:hypothetical protein